MLQVDLGLESGNLEGLKHKPYKIFLLTNPFNINFGDNSSE